MPKEQDALPSETHEPSARELRERLAIQEGFKKQWGWEEVDPATIPEPLPDHLDGTSLIRFNPWNRPESNPRYTRLCEKVRERWAASPPACAAVINFLPIPLFSDSMLPPLRFPGCQVPAAKGPGKFGLKTFLEAFIEPAFQPDGGPFPFDWYPIQLAQEFVKTNPEGVAVIVFESVLPDVIQGPEIDLAQQEATAWCKRHAEEPIVIDDQPYPSPWKDIAIRRLIDLKK